MTPYELGALAAQRANVPGHLKQAYAQGFAESVEKRAQGMPEGTVPLMTPVSDPRLKHLQGPAVTRRQAWNTAVGPRRANTIIDSATKYRAANPELFKGVFDGRNVDRTIPVEVGDNARFMSESAKRLSPKPHPDTRGLYFPVSGTRDWEKKPMQQIRDSILVKPNVPWNVLMHELLHQDTADIVPQLRWPALQALAKANPDDADWEPLQRLYQSTQYPTNHPAHRVQDITGPTHLSRTRNPVEIGTQLGTLRAHLEQQGVDTTNTNALRSAIQNLKQHSGGNDEAQRFHDAIHAPSLTPERKKSVIDDLTRLLPGIARNTRGARQGAPAYSSSLRS